MELDSHRSNIVEYLCIGDPDITKFIQNDLQRLAFANPLLDRLCKALQKIVAQQALQLGKITIRIGGENHLECCRRTIQKCFLRETAVGFAKRVDPMTLDNIRTAS